MENNPYVQRIFEMAGFLDGKERLGVSIAMIATEAYQMSKHYPDFAAYMDKELGKDWYARPDVAGDNGSVKTVIVFFQYLETGAFRDAKPVATLEA